MKNYLIPALGIILTTIILVLINEYTEATFVRDYAYLLIIIAMLMGVGLAQVASKQKN